MNLLRDDRAECFMVRAGRGLACIAHVRRVAKGAGALEFLRASPDEGPLPDTTMLAGWTFVNRAAVRRALVTLMREARDE